MTLHTPSLPIRQADTARTPGQTTLPTFSQTFASRDSLGISTDQRLPSIHNLLRSVPPPPVQPQLHPFFPPSPLPSPIGASPSLFSSPYPSWPALPPRRKSVSDHHSGSFPPGESLGPRRASTGCIARMATVPSYPVPEQLPAYHRQPSPDRDHNRQRRATKQVARRQRQSRSPDSSSHSYADYAAAFAQLEATTQKRLSMKTTTTTNKNNQTTTTTSTIPTIISNNNPANKSKQKRNNQPYTFEQEAFTIYHRVDLEMTWEQVRAAYMARWPSLNRTASGLECAYYRTNGVLPATTADGLLMLVDPEVDVEIDMPVLDEVEWERQQRRGQQGVYTPPATPDLLQSENGGGGGESGSEGATEGEGEEDEGSNKKRVWYKYYKGAAYRTRQVKCRKALVSLMQRFPEELVDERNDWVREEHRVLARGIAERRRRQREEWLAAREVQKYQRMMNF